MFMLFLRVTHSDLSIKGKKTSVVERKKRTAIAKDRRYMDRKHWEDKRRQMRRNKDSTLTDCRGETMMKLLYLALA